MCLCLSTLRCSDCGVRTFPLKMHYGGEKSGQLLTLWPWRSIFWPQIKRVTRTAKFGDGPVVFLLECTRTFTHTHISTDPLNALFTHGMHASECKFKLESTGYSALPLPPRIMRRAIDTWYKRLGGHTYSVPAWRRAALYFRWLSGGEGNYREEGEMGQD